jgi:peptide/nickel transport system permease protein
MSEQKKSIPVRTPTQLALKRFRKSKLAMAGLWVLSFLYLSSLLAGFLAPYGESHPQKKYSLTPPSLHLLRFKRPDGHFSLRPWFVPFATTHDPETGANIDNSCPESGLDFFKKACTYNPQEIVLFSATGDAADDYTLLLGLIKGKRHLFATRSLLPGGAPEPFYLAGADLLGRDIFSRILYGSQISLTIGLIGIFISFSIGILIGGLSGFYGGWIDDAIQRIGEVFMSVPSIYLILAVQAVAIQSVAHFIKEIHKDPVFAAKHGFWARMIKLFNISDQLDARTVYMLIIIILALVGWAGVARVVRGMVLAIRELDYVTASKALGARDLRVIVYHLLPNTMTFLIIQATLSIPYYILSEVVLSFLGVGIKEPAASWGTMLTAARQTNILLKAPWLLLPGLAIFVTVMAYNLLGDGLRDALDPRQKIK